METKLFNRIILFIAATLALGTFAQAQLLYDQNVTPDVIFGSGNANGAFTVDQSGGVELGLRAKLRFDATNQPQNTFNSNGDGTYTFAAGLPPSGFGWAPGSTSTAVWNFEWSVNSDYGSTSGKKLDDFTYLMEIDFDPSAATNFLSFDPINLSLADHAIGDNSTGNGEGIAAPSETSYASLISNFNVAQNSWNMEFFDDAGSGFPFDGSVSGTYDIRLSAFDGSNSPFAQSAIQVAVIPEPATNAAIGLLGLGAALFFWRRKRHS